MPLRRIIYFPGKIYYSPAVECWHVIYDGRRLATFNMAADAYLFDRARKGDTVPIIRIYGWVEPSITIGYHQKPAQAIDLSKLNGTPVVRRITGGRALLHDHNELTYAVSGNFKYFPILGEELHESYRLISEAIVDFYRSQGWRAAISRRDNPIKLARSVFQQKGCFSSVSKYEILVNDLKVAAGSQRRTNSAMIQHGAIKIAQSDPHPAIAEDSQVVDNSIVPAIRTDRQDLERRLVEAFERVFGVRLAARGFSAGELNLIRRSQDQFGCLEIA